MSAVSGRWQAWHQVGKQIANVSVILDQQVQQQVPVLAQVLQLFVAIKEEGTDIPQATINSLVKEM